MDLPGVLGTYDRGMCDVSMDVLGVLGTCDGGMDIPGILGTCDGSTNVLDTWVCVMEVRMY